MTADRSPAPRFRLGAAGTVARKEFLDNFRSRWILALSAIFVILTLAVSYFGAAQAGGETGFQGLLETVLGMIGVEVFLVPILGLMLGYGTVVGEKERGSMLLLLSMPVTRAETILGKFLGLGAVMLVAILGGLGVAGGVVMAFAGTEGWREYLIFIGGSVAFALAFLSIGLLVSTLTRRRTTAMGLGIFAWFFFVLIFDLILTGVYVATGGTLDLTPGGQWRLPDWYYALSMISPADSFSYFVSDVFGIRGGFGFTFEVPEFLNARTTSLSLALWIVVPMALSLWRFRRQDL